MLSRIFSSRLAVKLFLILVVVLAYSPTLQNGFVNWDDNRHIFENPYIRSLEFENLRVIFTAPINYIYMPLSTLSFAIEYHFFGLNPFYFHLDNLILYVLVVLLCFQLGMRLGLAQPIAFVAALLFALHPTHVESVAWATERKDVLYAVFYLWTLNVWMRYLEAQEESIKDKHARRKAFAGGFYYGSTIVLTLLSMLAKPMALSLPLVLLLLDWFKKRRLSAQLLVEKIPHFAIVIFFGWLTYHWHMRTPGQPPAEGILLWIWSFVFYIRQMVFPIFLVPIYRFELPITLSNSIYLFSTVIFVLLGILVWRWRRARWFVFAFGFYFLSIFFLLRFDILQDINIVADRFMFLPILGFCFLAAKAYGDVLKTRYRVGAQAAVALVAAIFFVMTFKQSQVWKDSETLWRHQLRYFPGEPIGLNNLAFALREKPEYEKAMAQYRIAVGLIKDGVDKKNINLDPQALRRVNEIVMLYTNAAIADPTYTDSHFNLAKVYQSLGKTKEAEQFFRHVLTLDASHKGALANLALVSFEQKKFKEGIAFLQKLVEVYPGDEEIQTHVINYCIQALKDNPGQPELLAARNKFFADYAGSIEKKRPTFQSYFNLAFIQQELNQIALAINYYRNALELRPRHFFSLNNLANLYHKIGDIDNALKYNLLLTKYYPHNADAFYNTAVIYDGLGQKDKARRYYEKAVQVDPTYALAYFMLGVAQEQAGELLKSKTYYEKAVKYDPSLALAQYNLGNVLAQIGNQAEAIAAYKKAVEANPNYEDALVNLSILLTKEGRYKEAIVYLDEAMLLGYQPPQAFVDGLKPYRK